MINTLIEFHTELFNNLHALIGISPFWDQAILFFARDADLYVMAAAMLFMLAHQHHKHVKANMLKGMSFVRELVLITSAVFAAWIASFLLKELIGGLRPFEMYESLKPLFIYGGGDSFPSGHATIFSALALMLVMLHRKAGVIFVILAVLISLGRVIAGIHYPIDIFGGWLIGGVVSYLVFQLLKKKGY